MHSNDKSDEPPQPPPSSPHIFSKLLGGAIATLTLIMPLYATTHYSALRRSQSLTEPSPPAFITRRPIR
ncbi:MAG: hypothetical protein HC934_04575 [Acaryochloridaceae cyanobacterium SU_2_1]|nr:hypothetical protein [Acaryochloridaceae cyanobacterium SU_2_1]